MHCFQDKSLFCSSEIQDPDQCQVSHTSKKTSNAVQAQLNHLTHSEHCVSTQEDHLEVFKHSLYSNYPEYQGSRVLVLDCRGFTEPANSKELSKRIGTHPHIIGGTLENHTRGLEDVFKRALLFTQVTVQIASFLCHWSHNWFARRFPPNTTPVPFTSVPVPAHTSAFFRPLVSLLWITTAVILCCAPKSMRVHAGVSTGGPRDPLLAGFTVTELPAGRRMHLILRACPQPPFELVCFTMTSRLEYV